MSQETLRLECLKLALARQGAADPRPLEEIYRDLLALAQDGAEVAAATAQPRRR